MHRALLTSTMNTRADQILQELVEALASAFPDRVRSLYISGSTISGDAVTSSDIDGLVIFASEVTSDEAQRYRSLAEALSVRHGVLLDIVLLADQDVFTRGDLPEKAASRRLIYGEDIRHLIPAIPLWQYGLATMQGSWFYLTHVREDAAHLALPLKYPDPAGEFFGYERNGARSLSGWDLAGTKALVGGVTLAATTLVSLGSGIPIVRSSDAVQAYAQHIGDAHSDWLVRVYQPVQVRVGLSHSPCGRRTVAATGVVPASAGVRERLPGAVCPLSRSSYAPWRSRAARSCSLRLAPGTVYLHNAVGAEFIVSVRAVDVNAAFAVGLASRHERTTSNALQSVFTRLDWPATRARAPRYIFGNG
jgi:predicted nucleotidyltransferase